MWLHGTQKYAKVVHYHNESIFSSLDMQLTSQIITFEHEGNWSKALECYDLQVRSEPTLKISGSTYSSVENSQQAEHASFSRTEHGMMQKKPYKGLIRSLQKIGCSHVLDVYCQGLTSQRGRFQHDLEFTELQVWYIFCIKLMSVCHWPLSLNLSFIMCVIENRWLLFLSSLSSAVWSCLACGKLGFLSTLFWCWCISFISMLWWTTFQWKFAQVFCLDLISSEVLVA